MVPTVAARNGRCLKICVWCRCRRRAESAACAILLTLLRGLNSVSHSKPLHFVRAISTDSRHRRRWPTPPLLLHRTMWGKQHKPGTFTSRCSSSSLPCVFGSLSFVVVHIKRGAVSAECRAATVEQRLPLPWQTGVVSTVLSVLAVRSQGDLPWAVSFFLPFLLHRCRGWPTARARLAPSQAATGPTVPGTAGKVTSLRGDQRAVQLLLLLLV
jgi:hypothetical protein